MFKDNFSKKFMNKVILNLKSKRYTPGDTIYEVFNFYLLWNFF